MTLIVLAKAPMPGRVKTRLCPPCDPEQAANPVSVYWLSTAYTGPINGTISFDW